MAFKILLVEDDNNLREIYEARLQAEGYVIVTAKDGEQALVVAKAEKPDLIISDVMMPRISGFEMLDIMRNTDELKYTKVIMLTALGQAEDKTRANSLGANRYLVKSQVTLEDIVKAAHELTDEPTAAYTMPPTATPPVSTTSAGPVAPPPVVPVQEPPAAAIAIVPSAQVPAAAAVPTPPGAQLPQPQPLVQPVMMPPEPTPPLPNLPAPSVQAPAPAPIVAIPPAPAATAAPATDTARPAFMTNFSTPVAQATAQPATTASAPQPAPQPQPDADQLHPASTAEEQANVAAQIADFAQQQSASSNTPPVVTAPTAAPDIAASQDDDILAGAVNNLAASTNQTAPATMVPPTILPHPQPPIIPADAPTAAFPPTAAANSNSVTIANKKIIRPLEHEPRPSLDDLLAREQEKTLTETGYGQVMTAPTPIVEADPSTSSLPPSLPAAPAPGAAFSPSPQPATPQFPAPAPAPNSGFDPSSIAL